MKGLAENKQTAVRELRLANQVRWEGERGGGRERGGEGREGGRERGGKGERGEGRESGVYKQMNVEFPNVQCVRIVGVNVQCTTIHVCVQSVVLSLIVFKTIHLPPPIAFSHVYNYIYMFMHITHSARIFNMCICDAHSCT